MNLHKKRNKIILLTILAVILILLTLLLLPQDHADSFNLAIDPDEIYRITWWSVFGRERGTTIGEATDRDDIEAIVAHLNAWTLVERRPRRGDIGGETPDMQIRLFDAEGNLSWGWSVRETRFLLNEDGWRFIANDWRPVSRFTRIFE